MVSGYPDTRRMKLFWQLVSGKGLVGLWTAFLYDVSSAFCQDKRPRWFNFDRLSVHINSLVRLRVKIVTLHPPPQCSYRYSFQIYTLKRI